MTNVNTRSLTTKPINPKLNAMGKGGKVWTKRASILGAAIAEKTRKEKEAKKKQQEAEALKLKELEEQRLLKEQENQCLIEEAIAKANCEREELAQKEALAQVTKEGFLIPASPQANAHK